MRNASSRILIPLLLIAVAAPAWAQSDGGEALLRASPPGIHFGRVAVGTVGKPRRIRLRNTGDETAIVYSLALPAGFQLGSFDCFDGGLAPGQSCSVRVAAAPSASGTSDGALRVQFCLPSDPVCPGAVFGQERYIDIPLFAAGR